MLDTEAVAGSGFGRIVGRAMPGLKHRWTRLLDNTDERRIVWAGHLSLRTAVADIVAWHHRTIAVEAVVGH